LGNSQLLLQGIYARNLETRKFLNYGGGGGGGRGDGAIIIVNWTTLHCFCPELVLVYLFVYYFLCTSTVSIYGVEENIWT